MRIIRDVVQTLLLAMFFYLALQTTMQTRFVKGASMEPNLEEYERLWVNKIVYYRASWLEPLRPQGYLFHPPRRGEVVVFHPYPNGPDDYIKRVVGLPGEVVEVRDGLVYINGHPIPEPYVKEAPRYSLPPILIPPGYYFVLGDNRNSSIDSHNLNTLGPVPAENIIGKAWISYWPPKNWGLVPTFSSP